MVFSNASSAKTNPPKIFINQNKKNGPQNLDLIAPIENVTAASPEPAIRYLGVYFDPNLNFKYHIQTLTKKISKCSFFIDSQRTF